MQRNGGRREFLPSLGQNVPFQLRYELDIRVGAALGRPRSKKKAIVRKRSEKRERVGKNRERDMSRNAKPVSVKRSNYRSARLSTQGKYEGLLPQLGQGRLLKIRHEIRKTFGGPLGRPRKIGSKRAKKSHEKRFGKSRNLKDYKGQDYSCPINRLVGRKKQCKRIMQRNGGIREFWPSLGRNVPFQLRYELDIGWGAALDRPRSKKKAIVRSETVVEKRCKARKRIELEIVTVVRMRWNTRNVACKVLIESGAGDYSRPIPCTRWNISNVACNVLTESGAGDYSRPIPNKSNELAESRVGDSSRPTEWSLIRLHAELVAINFANVTMRLYGAGGYDSIHFLSCPALETLDQVCFVLRKVSYSHH
jgi:hypothetical protein